MDYQNNLNLFFDKDRKAEIAKKMKRVGLSANPSLSDLYRAQGESEDSFTNEVQRRMKAKGGSLSKTATSSPNRLDRLNNVSREAIKAGVQSGPVSQY